MPLCLEGGLLLLLLDLEQQRTVDVRQDTTKRNRGADQSIELLVTTDRQLQVAGGDTLDLQILGSVACQLQHFGCQVLEHGGHVHSCLGANAHLVLRVGLEETLDTTTGELDC